LVNLLIIYLSITNLITLRSSWLEERNLNTRTSYFVRKPSFSYTLEINSYLTQYIEVFEDLKLMAEMRQEIDKLNGVS